MMLINHMVNRHISLKEDAAEKASILQDNRLTVSEFAFETGVSDQVIRYHLKRGNITNVIRKKRDRSDHVPVCLIHEEEIEKFKTRRKLSCQK